MLDSKKVGLYISRMRKKLAVSQKQLALTSGTDTRFISDLENGKESCELGKALMVIQTLGIKITLTPPPIKDKEKL